MKISNLKNPIAGFGTDVLTQERHPVIKGEIVFFLMDSKGLPFDILLDVFRERGYSFDLVGFIKSAKQSGNFSRKRLEFLFQNNIPNSLDYSDLSKNIQLILDSVYMV